MTENRAISLNELNVIIKERGRKVLERFGEATLSDISNSELFSMMEEVKTYWADSFRPALISFCCEAIGAKPAVVFDAGLMLTLADSGISIHDDIIDKSLRKHFRKTILGTHGIDKTMLLGDLLIIKAWSVIGEIAVKTNNPRITSAFAESYKRSCVDMCEAELVGLSNRKSLDVDLTQCEEVLWKVNSGIKACAELGAIISDATNEEIGLMSEFGKNLALILGLRDDLRDSLNLEGYLPHRLQNESVPMPLVYAAKSSKKLYSKIRDITKKSSVSHLDLRELVKICSEAGAFAYMAKLAYRAGDQAKRHLGTLKPSHARKILMLIVDMNTKNVGDLVPQ